VTVEKVRTDTLMVLKHTHDSIYKHDSVIVSEKGDTVKIERWHTRYIEREKHDTIYQATHDTIPKPYPVEKLVAASLTWWQQTRLHLANILLWSVGIVGIGWFVRWKLMK
jgi:hypothetical protein